MSDEGIITYEKLYEVLRIEKYKKELQRLDEGFFIKVVNYLDEKKAILHSQENKESLFASQSIIKTKRQIENTKMILKELYERREAKIINMALFNSRTGEKTQEMDSILGDELKLYYSLIGLFNAHRSGILENILNCKPPLIGDYIKKIEEKTEVKSNKLVKFLQTVPQFMGEDLQVYGPFQPDDIADLPIKVSEILIKNKRVEEI